MSYNDSGLFAEYFKEPTTSKVSQAPAPAAKRSLPFSTNSPPPLAPISGNVPSPSSPISKKTKFPPEEANKENQAESSDDSDYNPNNKIGDSDGEEESGAPEENSVPPEDNEESYIYGSKCFLKTVKAFLNNFFHYF